MNQVELTDVYKGAYFLTRSCRVKDIKLVNNNQVRFVIEGENLAQEEEQHQTEQATVDPLQLNACLNYLRKKLKQSLRTREPNRNPHERHC